MEVLPLFLIAPASHLSLELPGIGSVGHGERGFSQKPPLQAHCSQSLVMQTKYSFQASDKEIPEIKLSKGLEIVHSQKFFFKET